MSLNQASHNAETSALAQSSSTVDAASASEISDALTRTSIAVHQAVEEPHFNRGVPIEKLQNLDPENLMAFIRQILHTPPSDRSAYLLVEILSQVPLMNNGQEDMIFSYVRNHLQSKENEWKKFFQFNIRRLPYGIARLPEEISEMFTFSMNFSIPDPIRSQIISDINDVIAPQDSIELILNKLVEIFWRYEFQISSDYLRGLATNISEGLINRELSQSEVINNAFGLFEINFRINDNYLPQSIETMNLNKGSLPPYLKDRPLKVKKIEIFNQCGFEAKLMPTTSAQSTGNGLIAVFQHLEELSLVNVQVSVPEFLAIILPLMPRIKTIDLRGTTNNINTVWEIVIACEIDLPSLQKIFVADRALTTETEEEIKKLAPNAEIIRE